MVHFTGSGKPQCVIGLAVAGTMKIVPFALGFVYFAKWRWRPVLLCGVLSLVFMFVPWAFCRDGFAALPVMMKNAAEHSQYVLRASDFGLVQLWRTFRIVAGQSVNEVWPDLKVSDPSVEDLLYMIDEEGREACIKLYTFLL